MSRVNRALLGLALALGGLAAVVRSPAPPATTAVDLDALARIVDHEEDHVTAPELAAWIRDRRTDLRVIDVRSDSDYRVGHIPRAEHMTLSQLRTAGFRPTETIVLYSAGGAHAAQGWFLLRASGLPRVYSLRGGIDEWLSADTTMTRTRSWRRGC